MAEKNDKVGSVLVLGGGIGGMQAALDLANAQYKVYLVERNPAIGGVMAQLDKTFPTNDCSMCTLAPRLVDCGQHLDIEKLTYSEVEDFQGAPGRFKVRVRRKARYVDTSKCTGCGQCVENCLVRNIPYTEPLSAAQITLEPEELEKLRSIVQRYKNGEGIAVPALQEVQAHFNYLPEKALRYLSGQLQIPLSLLYRLATFYNAFSLTPKGKYVVRVCTGTSCYVKGARRILNAFEKYLGIPVGSITGDKQFSLETVNCLGCCGQSPVLTVNEDLYGYVRQAKVVELMRKYRE